MQRKPGARFALIGFALSLLAGCGTQQSASQAAIAAPPGVALPVSARVAVQVAPNAVNTQTVEYQGETWSYPDAQLMQQAALNVFRQIFTDVGSLESLGAPAITVRLTPNSTLNPLMNQYYANPTATVFPGGDTYTQPIGTYTGSGTSSQMNFTNAGIASAYDAAFRQIGNAMLADSKLLARAQGK